MSNNETVVPIRERAEREKTAFKLPPDVRSVLSELEDRVSEARSIAKLLTHYLAAGEDPDDVSADRAVDAIVRLLDPVQGLSDDVWLDLRARQLAAAKSLNETVGGAS